MRFSEPRQIPPSDELGNLNDLGTEPGITAPSAAPAWTGAGRLFRQTAHNGFIASDMSGNGTLLQRDVTIQVLLSLTLAGASGAQTLIARGVNNGTTSERYSYALELEEQADAPGYVEIRWYWQDSLGNVRPQPPGVIKSPGDGVEFVLTATRRWESTSRVVVRYYVGADLVAEFVSQDGDISGGTVGHTTIGAQKSAGAYGRFFNGTIDELLVTDNEMSPEEVRHVWRRLSEYQPGGVETFGALSPPGSTWARNPGSDIGKRTKVVGQMLGLAVAGAEELRALLLPDAAPLGIIERWERICELAAGPGDSLDVRRARVLAFLARDQGFTLPAIQTALSGPMALAPEQIEVVEFTNTITDDFTSLRPERWLDGRGAAWTAATSTLHAVAQAGTELRWELGATPFLLAPAEPGRIYVAARLDVPDPADVPEGAFCGLALHDRATNDWLWYGVWNNAGLLELAWRAARGGVAAGPFHGFLAVSAGPIWLRILTDQSAPFTNDGAMQLWFSHSGPDSGFLFLPVQVVAPTRWSSAGFTLSSTANPFGVAFEASFGDFTLHTADGQRPYLWYAFRDPALPGTPDMMGSNLLVQKIKPAYTHGAAIISRSVLCDDAQSGLCDRGPLGAL